MEKAHIKARKLLGRGVIGDVITFNICCGFDCTDKLEMIQYIMDRQVIEKTCRPVMPDKTDPENETIRVADNMFYILKMDNGVIGTMTVSKAFCRKEQNSVVLYGEDGTMRIKENTDFPVVVIDGDGDRICYSINESKIV